MNTPALIRQMERFPAVLAALLAGIDADRARRRGPDGQWSIVEVLAHLADEETADFRARLIVLLDDPERDFEPIDPGGWAEDRGYLERDHADELDRFAAARAGSISWLRSLECPDFSRAKHHPTMGPLHAGDVLAAWAAHDLLHLRQITKRLYELTGADAEPYAAFYAGDW
ncbi:MAG: DinB family protein [Planctomycetota bacterium]